MNIGTEVADALSLAFGMFWEILWALILGFALSAVVQAVVSKGDMQRLLPDDRPRSLARASLLGAASSSCSYATVALARSICARERTSPLRRRSRSPPPTSSSRSGSSWR
jgi:uncharacterized membrane protein YraQ (UPF0718 family)